MPLTKSELKAWTDELRAHPEQQIHGRLVNNEETGFCCLGKLCQTLGHASDLIDGDRGFLGERTDLPVQVASKLEVTPGAGLCARIGSFVALGMPELRGRQSLAYANDSDVTWAEIADHLDAHYPAEDDRETER
jgi:hypothetical protein